eukprot:241796-Chlamydomonas_euryale.AAC.2
MAVGLACTGTGLKDATSLLEPMLSDPVDFVRQGALIAMALVMLQQGGAALPEKRELEAGRASRGVSAPCWSPFALMHACVQRCLRPAVVALCVHPRPVIVRSLRPAIASTIPPNLHPVVIACDVARASTSCHRAQPESRLASFRKRLDKLIKDKHEEVMCKMGAIMAAGIIDAGGRNVGVGLRSRSGYFRRTSVVALAVFTQYW